MSKVELSRIDVQSNVVRLMACLVCCASINLQASYAGPRVAGKEDEQGLVSQTFHYEPR